MMFEKTIKLIFMNDLDNKKHKLNLISKILYDDNNNHAYVCFCWRCSFVKFFVRFLLLLVLLINEQYKQFW